MSICSGSNVICRKLIRSIFAIPITTPTHNTACLTKIATSTSASELRTHVQIRHVSDAAITALKRDKDVSGILYETENKIYPLRHTVQHYNKRIGNYVKNMKHSNQLQLHVDYTIRRMKEKGIEPTEHTYLLAILGMAKQRHKMPYQEERIEKWFYDFLTLQLRRPKSFNNFKTVLLAISKHGHPKMKEMVLAIHRAFPDLDVECWNAALIGSMKAKASEKAQQLFDIARTEGKVDANSYWIMVESYLHFDDLSSAKNIFATMMSDAKHTADNRFYRAFLQFYAKTIPNKETFLTMEKLWQAVLATTQEQERIPLPLIESLLRYYFKHGQLALAEQLFLDIRARHQPLNAKCIIAMYCIIRRFCRRRQLKSAISLYYEMMAENYPINNNALRVILETSLVMKDVEPAEHLVKTVLQFDPSAKINRGCLKAIQEAKHRS